MRKNNVLAKLKKRKALSSGAASVVSKIRTQKNQCPYREYALPLTGGEARTGSRMGDLLEYFESVGIYMYDSHTDDRLSSAQAEKLITSSFVHERQIHNVIWSFRSDSRVASQATYNSKCEKVNGNTNNGEEKGVKEQKQATSKKSAAKVALLKKLAAKKAKK